MYETAIGCDCNFSAIEDAVGQLMIWASKVPDIGSIGQKRRHILNNAINIRTLNQQHQRKGRYQAHADDGILSLSDAINGILKDGEFRSAVSRVSLLMMESEVNQIKKAVAMRTQANRKAVVDFEDKRRKYA